MELKELMLNDWVKIINPKGEWIDNAKLDVNLLSIYLDDEEDTVFTCKPVPLTEEILILNGFKKDGYTSISPDYYYEDDICSIYISLKTCCGNDSAVFCRNKGVFPMTSEIGGKNIRQIYVHQLQHALRLVGLQDFADNFKIK